MLNSMYFNRLYFGFSDINRKNQNIIIMNTDSKQLIHLTGKQAYLLYWEQVYECRPRLSSIKLIDLNLEIIIDHDFRILAYRHDLPDDMMWMVLNAGHWQIFGRENLSPELHAEVKETIGKSFSNLFWN